MMSTTIEHLATQEPRNSRTTFGAGLELDFIASEIGNLAAVARLASTAEMLDVAEQRALAGIADMADAIAKRADAASSLYIKRPDCAGAQADGA